MKIEITFAESQQDDAAALVNKLKQYYPGLITKQSSGKPNTHGIKYQHIRLDDGRRW